MSPNQKVIADLCQKHTGAEIFSAEDMTIACIPYSPQDRQENKTPERGVEALGNASVPDCIIVHHRNVSQSKQFPDSRALRAAKEDMLPVLLM
jgi:hypothetical protein